jgi:hypothetical protein
MDQFDEAADLFRQLFEQQQKTEEVPLELKVSWLAAVAMCGRRADSVELVQRFRTELNDSHDLSFNAATAALLCGELPLAEKYLKLADSRFLLVGAGMMIRELFVVFVSQLPPWWLYFCLGTAICQDTLRDEPENTDIQMDLALIHCQMGVLRELVGQGIRADGCFLVLCLVLSCLWPFFSV